MERLKAAVQRNIVMSVLVGIYVVTVIWWVSLAVRGVNNTAEAYWYNIFFTFIPFIGGAVSVVNIRSIWRTSQLHKAQWFISVGLLLWAVGNYIFAYYNIVLKIDVPYPSIAEVAFVPAFFCWVLGMLNLTSRINMKRYLMQIFKKGATFLLPLLFVIVSYYTVLTVEKKGVMNMTGWELKNLFDFIYTILDVIILVTLAVLVYGLIFRLLGRKNIIAIGALVVGFLFNYFADLTFAFTTSAGTYRVGHWVDLLFPTGLFFIAVGVALLQHEGTSPKSIHELKKYEEQIF